MGMSRKMGNLNFHKQMALERRLEALGYSEMLVIPSSLCAEAQDPYYPRMPSAWSSSAFFVSRNS